MIVIYVKGRIRPLIKDLVATRLKLGKANLGNKGACSIRFQYKDSTMAFACAHLNSGQKEGLPA